MRGDSSQDMIEEQGSSAINRFSRYSYTTTGASTLPNTSGFGVDAETPVAGPSKVSSRHAASLRRRMSGKGPGTDSDGPRRSASARRSTSRARPAVEVVIESKSPLTAKRKKKALKDLDPSYIDVDIEERWSPSRPSRTTPPATPPSAKKAKKIPRPFAPPETYAHLKHIEDHILPNLSILFCGINPGKRSSTEGHHFAHPTNKFWKSLYLSGITDRQVPPSEDWKMPDLYSFGLTNLCHRPTMEQSELSTLEMKLQVPDLIEKLQTYQPGVVCFVGKKIWDVFESVVSKTATRSTAPVSNVVKDEPIEDVSISSPHRTAVSPIISNPYAQRQDSPKIKEEPTENGVTLLSLSPSTPKRKSGHQTQSHTPPSTGHSTPLRSIPATPRTPSSKTSKNSSAAAKSFDWHKVRPFRLKTGRGYTYFWVTPSTSGLERTPHSEIAAIFRSLNEFSKKLQDGQQVDGQFGDIAVEGSKATTETIRTAALAKGKRV